LSNINVTPALLAKIKRLADDPSTDPMTRKIAQAQLDTHNGVGEPRRNPIHPGLLRTPEYEAWVKIMGGGVGRGPRR
jgi:hypothetical protein